MSNQNAPHDVNISDILRMSLPLETAVVSGGSHLRQNVRWASLLVSWDNLQNQVHAGDLVLVPPMLQEGISPTDLSLRIQELITINAAGIIFMGELPKKIKKLAEQWSIPILVSPNDTSVRETYRSIATMLVDRQYATAERGMQLYRMLAEMSREEQGLDAMTELISKLTGKIVVVQDKRLEFRSISIPQDNKISFETLQEVLQKRDELPAILRNRKAAARSRQSLWQQILPIENIGRLLSPIISGDRARGYLSIIGHADNLDLLDNLAAEHGAAACALEMAKAKAVSEAKKALRGNFLEGLLSGTLPRKEIDRLEGRLDHDTRQPHAVMTFSWRQGAKLSIRHLETAINWLLQNHHRPALVHTYAESHVIVFQALKTTDEMESALDFARRIQQFVQEEHADVEMIAGMSGPARNLIDWPIAYNEALQAMQLGERLNINQIVEFGSLGVYRLLGQLEDLPQVREFADQVIGPLVDYDAQHRSSLVQTMDAYFSHHANISQTAESLYIHRNTLLYRLDRIQELTQHDLNQSNMRLALHLALKLWQLRTDK